MTKDPNVLVAENPVKQAKLAASLFIRYARSTLLGKDHFDMVLPGGRTPAPFFRCLALEYADAIDWSHVRFFWSDERDVPPEDPDSNFRLANETLLKPLAIQADNIFRIPVGDKTKGAASAADEYERTLRSLFGSTPAFDYVLLGIGEDGHTASLFPDARQDWVTAEHEGHWVAAPWVPHLGARRITLLPRVLSEGIRVCFLVSGASKAAILRELLRFDADARGHGRIPYPAQLIRSNSGKPFWLLDLAAASRLTVHAA